MMVATRSQATGVLLVLGLAAVACQNAKPAADTTPPAQETTFTLVLPDAEPAREPAAEPEAEPQAQNAPAEYRPEYHPTTRSYVEQIESGLKPLESIPSLPGHDDGAAEPTTEPTADEGGDSGSVV
jgi:hypothetical protein